ncbi:MAG: 50S ribosomal protein L25 [Bacillota bacterium]
MKLEKRTDKLKNVREAQKVPGIVYGKDIEPTPVQTPYTDFVHTFSEYGKSMTFKADLEGETHMLYFKEIQVDPIRQNNILHFDLQKVTASETISAEIPLVLHGKDVVEKKGLVVEQINSTVETEFPAGSGISQFELDVTELEGNETMTVEDLELPEGFKVLEDDEKILVAVNYPQEEEEPEEEETTEEEDLEVEAIKQKGEDEEEESESDED